MGRPAPACLCPCGGGRVRMSGAGIDPRTATARGIAAAVHSGTVSAEAVAEAYLDHIAAVDGTVHAWAALDPARTLAEARACDAAGAAGPLAGVPLAVKDVIDSADMPTAYGSALYTGHRPAADAACLHLARAAGAVMAGKSVTTEFATMSPGPTANPFDAGRTPGGSSSGSAAALGAAMVPLAFGTQTSGSTIRPAAFCGVVGYKASLGLINRTGIKPLAENLDVPGLMARDLCDVALLAAVVARDPGLAVASIGALPSAGVFLPVQGGEAPGADAGLPVERAAKAIGSAAPVNQPAWWDALGSAHEQVFAWEAASALAFERDRHFDGVTEITRGFLARQAGATLEDWRAGLAARDAALADLDALFGGHDVLLTPAAPGEAPRGLGSTGSAAYNMRWTLLGTPSVTLPAGLGAEGMPVGVQIVARPGQDRALLHYAAAVEAALREAGHPARPGA